MNAKFLSATPHTPAVKAILRFLQRSQTDPETNKGQIKPARKASLFVRQKMKLGAQVQEKGKPNSRLPCPDLQKDLPGLQDAR